MGTNTLTNRSSGQTILEGFFNDIHSALNGDLVGRNSSGLPTSGQSLGTIALPFGAIRCNSLSISGSSIDTSSITSPANRIISGAIRTTSNQPAFISPHGSAASFQVLGDTTNLIYDVNGSEVTISTDITKSSLTTAPAANNTCLVDDTEAIDQDDTRYWGEINHRKQLIVDAMGSEIQSLVGTFQSFKVYDGVNTEYFYAYINSTILLTNAFRGYFYDSSGNPINRIKFANNDVITLMKTAYIFAENDGTTIDVTYNNPTWSYTSPSVSTTGDYWFDLANRVWKRYSGASWEIINRTFIGVAIMDNTNCVAARCIEYYAKYEETNTVNIEKISSTVVRGKNQYARVNVSGVNIEFENYYPSWDITSNLASSADMYNSSEQVSTPYYFYISHNGELKISDIAPYIRPDMLGEYHPHNTWRCVGIGYNDASSNLTVANGFYMDKSTVFLHTGNGHGAINTKIRRFSTVYINNTANVVFLDSANYGTSAEIKRAGKYAIHFNDTLSSAASIVGITKNADGTANVSTMTQADGKISISQGPAGYWVQLSYCGYFQIGDIIRPHTDGSNNGNDYNNYFIVERIGD